MNTKARTRSARGDFIALPRPASLPRPEYGAGSLMPPPYSGKCMLAGLALVSAVLQPDDGRPLARPAVGSRACRRRAPDPLNLVCLRRFLAAVLRIVRARSGPSSPSFVGACGPEILLRRSFLADFLRRFSVPCPAGRRDSTGTAPQASPAAKKQRGERGGWPVTFGRPTHPTSRQEGATPHERNTHA